MENILQDLQEPCFFISCVNPMTRLFLGKRYFRQNQFCIQYFPRPGKEQEECNATAERLMWCLEYILVNGEPIRDTNLNYKVEDGILNFFVNYDCFVYKISETEESFSNMESSTNVKGGD